jgi:hypothetical protein
VAAGDVDRAMTELERAYRERSPGLALVCASPRWDRLRSDARFGALLDRLHFPRR